MNQPTRTAEACRSAIRSYLHEIQVVLDAAEPTLIEISDIESHAAMVTLTAKRWLSAERLIQAAPKRVTA